MREYGEVVHVTADSVTVRMKRTSACARCHACKMGFDETEMLIVARNACNARPGNRVRVELQPEAFLSAALILYGLPFVGLAVGFVLGYFVGARWGLGDYAALSGFVGGLLLAALAYGIIKKLEPVWRSRGYTPVALDLAIDPERERETSGT